MNKAWLVAMPDVELRLRLVNTRLRIKIGTLKMQMKIEKGHSRGLSRLVAGVRNLRAEEDKWRAELVRRERQ